jgi:phasin family protein
MTSMHEQIATTTQATLGNQIAMCDAISKLAFHGIEKILAFNMSAAKDSLENVKSSSQQLFSIKKPGDLFAFSAEKPQPSIEKFIAFGRELALISTDMHNEVLQTLRVMSPMQAMDPANFPSFSASFSATDFNLPHFSFLTTLLKPNEAQSTAQTVVFKDLPREPKRSATTLEKPKTAPKKELAKTPVKTQVKAPAKPVASPSAKPAATVATKSTPKIQVKTVTKTPPKKGEKKTTTSQGKQLSLIVETPALPIAPVKARSAPKTSPSKPAPVVAAKLVATPVKKASTAKPTAPAKKITPLAAAKDAPVVAVQNGIVTASKAAPTIASTTPAKSAAKPSFPTVLRKSPGTKVK